MRRRAAAVALAALVVLAGGGCPADGPGDTVATTAAPLVAARALGLDPSEVLLDADATRLLIGALEPAPANADPPLRMRVRLEVDGEVTAWPYAGVVVARARLLGAAVLVETRTGELRRVDLGTGADELLDTGVEGAVGASLDGRHLVYTKGEMPDFEVFRLDLDTRKPAPVAGGMAPVWSPGISPDGRTVFFVSGRTGVPAWWRVEGTGPPVQLTNVGVAMQPDAPPPALAPFAAGLGPTLVGGGRVVFEGRDDVHVMSLDGRIMRTLAGASAPHWIRPGEVLGALDLSHSHIEARRLEEVSK